MVGSINGCGRSFELLVLQNMPPDAFSISTLIKGSVVVPQHPNDLSTVSESGNRQISAAQTCTDTL